MPSMKVKPCVSVVEAENVEDESGAATEGNDQ